MVTGFTMNRDFIVMFMDATNTRKNGKDFDLVFPISAIEKLPVDVIDNKRASTYKKLLEDDDLTPDDQNYLVNKYATLTVEFNKR